jgi:ADP-heptose:LPS heptosyltransferase
MIRFSSMGDVVLQTATVNWLRSLFGKELVVTFVTSREFVSLVEGHPGINHVIGFDRRSDSWNEFISRVKTKAPYDLILDLHATMRSFRLKSSFWSTPQLTVDKRRWERFFLTKCKSVTIRKFFYGKFFGLEPQVERIINDIQDIFEDTRGVRATRDFRKGPHEEMTSLPAPDVFPVPGKYIVLAPSASFEPKRWPVDSFVELGEKLLIETEYHLVVLAGPEDKFCQAFNRITSHRLLNLQGKTSLKESMQILARAELSIGNDSGMNHIAEAHGVPVITIFGPTHPLFGFAPHGKKSSFLSKELWCKPCSTTGSSPCYREDLFCMKEISVEEVMMKAREALA